MLQTHHVAISNLLNNLEPSQESTITPSGGENNDDTDSTGTASFTSLKEFSKMSKHFKKAE